jgi:NTE family protein
MRLPDAMRRFPWFSAEDWLKDSSNATPAPVAAPPPRLGLVLSCGGARGLAHVGVIQVLEREKIPVSAVIGSSMGAYVGALWAAGFDGQELEKLAAEIKDRRTLLRLIDPVCPPISGFLKGNKLRQHLEKSLGDKTISQLNKPMYIIATNLDTVTWEVLSQDTPVAAAVQASCAIPGIVAPVQYHGKRYIDGGASQPLPVSLMRQILAAKPLPASDGAGSPAPLDAIIAVNVMPTFEDLASAQICSYPSPPPAPLGVWGRFSAVANRNVNLFAYGNVLDTFKRCLTSAQLRLVSEEGARADVLIHPFFCESRWYDFENFTRYIDAGRKAAEAALPQIFDLIQRPMPRQPAPELEIDSALPDGRRHRSAASSSLSMTSYLQYPDLGN